MIYFFIYLSIFFRKRISGFAYKWIYLVTVINENKSIIYLAYVMNFPLYNDINYLLIEFPLITLFSFTAET